MRKFILILVVFLVINICNFSLAEEIEFPPNKYPAFYYDNQNWDFYCVVLYASIQNYWVFLCSTEEMYVQKLYDSNRNHDVYIIVNKDGTHNFYCYVAQYYPGEIDWRVGQYETINKTWNAIDLSYIYANYDIKFYGTDESVFVPVEGVRDFKIIEPNEKIYKDNKSDLEIMTQLFFERSDISYDESLISYDVDIRRDDTIVYNDIEVEKYKSEYQGESIVQNSKIHIHFDDTGRYNIKIYALYNGIIIGSDEIQYIKFNGFVDENNDGIDDRTGKKYRDVDNNSDVSGFDEIVEPQKPSEDAGVLDWIKYIFEYFMYILRIAFQSIKSLVSSLIRSINSLLSLANPMLDFMRKFFGSFPADMLNAFVAFFVVSVVISVWRLVRHG